MDRTGSNALASALFFIAVPGIIAGLVPYLITGWAPPDTTPYVIGLLVGVGGLIIGGGLLLLMDSFMRFVNEGKGTPMPWMPTEKLVARGFYRYVRNPMYVGVVAIILGQAVMFLSGWLVAYAALVWLAFHVYVTAVEEPTLRRNFGSFYADYLAAVPRWLPRLPPPANSAG